MKTTLDIQYTVVDTPNLFTNPTNISGLDNLLRFNLPSTLEAGSPPEARGLARDEVRLMISYQSNNHIEHTQFRQLSSFLEAGDVVVINTSQTINGALRATRADGDQLELHLSTRLPADLWLVELRQPVNNKTIPFADGIPGEQLNLPDGGLVQLQTPYLSQQRADPVNNSVRLWVATLQTPEPLYDYLNHHGFPIRYGYVKEAWPLSYYQTVYGTEPGSAEMPSAGRAFTTEIITQLVAQGVQIAPLILHTGVASLESHEPPYEEFYRVPLDTARLINQAKQAGKRIIAVGTTVVRALETVVDSDGLVHPGEGWTRLVITPDRPLQAVNGMLTGLHEPEATHLAMLQALADLEHLELSYTEALQHHYLWHEFGDLHLILS